jgi:ankyrin repeat protein
MMSRARSSCFLILAAAFFCAPAWAAAVEGPFAPTWAIVNGTRAVLREGPGADSREVAAVDRGAVVHLDRRSDRKAPDGKLKDWWYHADVLDTADGMPLVDRDGWIFGAFLTLVTRGGDVPLLASVAAGDEPAVKKLLRNGANPNARTAAWVTAEGSAFLAYTSALLTALEADRPTVARLLISAGADVNEKIAKPGLELTVAAVAAQAGYWDLVHEMVKRKAAPTPDIAAAAIAQGNREELLWALGAGVPASGGVRYGPYDGNSLVNVALKSDKVDLARLLVEHGAALNIVALIGGESDDAGATRLVSTDTYGPAGVAEDVSPQVKEFLQEHYRPPQQQ